MARAEPAFVLALVPERHATQMRADAGYDQPFRLPHPRLVRLRIPEFAERNVLAVLDFFLRPVTNEHRSAAPFDRDNLTFGDRADIDFGRGQRERGRVRTHLSTSGQATAATPTA